MDHIKRKMKLFSRFTVEHPRFKHAVEGILESINDTNEMEDPASAMLLGPPGTGKSSICRRIEGLLGPPREEVRKDCKIKIIPCVYFRVPENGTVNSFLLQVLLQLDSRCTAHDAATMMHSIITQLKTCETIMCIVDEIQHLSEKGASKTQARMCNCIKTLLNETRIPFLAAGTPKFEAIFDDNSQLAQRYPVRFRLENFDYDYSEDTQKSEWRLVLAKFGSEMIRIGELTEYVYLSDEYFSKAIYIFTGGNMRGLRLLLHYVLKRSLVRGDHVLTKLDFERIADKIQFHGRIEPNINPFRCDNQMLDTILSKRV